MPTQEKISDLPTATAFNSGDYVPVVDNSGTPTTRKITKQNLIASLGSATAGWNNVGSTPSSVTALGNRSYQVVVSAVDLTGVIAAGMKLRFTRSTPAPTQATSLNGTNQYWSKTSPAGMTFTDDFAVSAWVWLTSYPGSGSATIVSRCDSGANNGWGLRIGTGGQVSLFGATTSSSNFSQIISYQAVPLKRWVHIAAQLDMSSFTATATTSYIMLDGVDVPSSVGRAGSNPVAFTQGGTFMVGAEGAPTNFFPGKIAQVAVFNAKVTQATIRTYISQGLAGTEPSLISGFAFNGTATDLNTTNANNLTSNNAVTATDANSPFGNQASGLVSSTIDYGIITNVVFSTNTTITVQVPEGCTIPTSGNVSALDFSTSANPYGLPSIGKWKLAAFDTSGTITTPLLDTMVQYVLDHPLDNLLFTNPGSAGGSYYMSQIGNVKQVSGVSANSLVATSAGPQFGITIPAGFFSAVVYGNATIQQLQTTAQQNTAGGTFPTVNGWNVTLWASATTAGQQFGFSIIGR